MPRLILTREADLLLLVTIALASVSPASVAARLRDLLPILRGLRQESSYLVVLAFVAAAGVWVARPPSVPGDFAWTTAAGIAAGIPAGALAFRADQDVLRAHRRRAQRRARVVGGRLGTTVASPQEVPVSMRWRLPAIGVLEEVVFRGVLFWYAFEVAQGLVVTVILLVVTTILFAANHLPFGNVHVLAKLPLSAVAGAVTLLSGSVAGAAVAHAWFNYRVAVQGRRSTLTFVG